MRELAALHIETERLIIRRLAQKDLQDFFEIVSCKEIAAKDGFRPYETIKQFLSDFQGFLVDEYRYVAEYKTQQKVVGVINFRQTDVAARVFEIGYDVNKSYWRQGFAHEFLSAFIRLCINGLHVEMIKANCYDNNDASMGLLKKLGFCYSGKVSDYHAAHGAVFTNNFYIDKEIITSLK